jgi:hypothetical protein
MIKGVNPNTEIADVELSATLKTVLVKLNHLRFR